MKLLILDALDKADKTVHDFFKIAPSLTTDDRHRQFEKIKDVYINLLNCNFVKICIPTAIFLNFRIIERF